MRSTRSGRVGKRTQTAPRSKGADGETEAADTQETGSGSGERADQTASPDCFSGSGISSNLTEKHDADRYALFAPRPVHASAGAHILHPTLPFPTHYAVAILLSQGPSALHLHPCSLSHPSRHHDNYFSTFSRPSINNVPHF